MALFDCQNNTELLADEDLDQVPPGIVREVGTFYYPPSLYTNTLVVLARGHDKRNS